MDFLAVDPSGDKPEADGSERRQSTRFTSLIRAAKIISPQGEFICVIRDVSETGIGLRLFHKLPVGGRMELMLQNGECYELDKVRSNETDASFTFADTVDVDKLIVESGSFEKRQVRVAACFPAKIKASLQCHDALIHNISQQGALIECDAQFALEQPLRLEAPELSEIRAKVRWRSDENYGLAFDTTFSLREFAVKVASLQCPTLFT